MAATESIPVDESVLIFSDLHLGGADDTQTACRFCRFLDHLLKGHRDVVPCGMDTGTSPTVMRPPSRVILLGDILELWDPRAQDRHSALLDALVPLLKLRELGCTIVYVTGNHDEDVGELVDTVDTAGSTRAAAWREVYRVFSGHEDGRRVPESLKIAWNDAYRVNTTKNGMVVNARDILEISPRHYPAATTGGDVMGLEAGGVHYAFFHGQQFDNEQYTYAISRAIGRRFDLVDSMEDLACCSIIRNTDWRMRIVLSLVAFAVSAIGFYPESELARLAAGATTAVALALMGAAGVWLFGLSSRARKGFLPPTSGHLLWASGILFALVTASLAWGYRQGLEGVLGAYFLAGLLFGLFWTFTITLPTLFAWIKNPIYRLFSARNRSTEEIYRNAMHGRLYRYRAEVLVFGHTHVAESYPRNRAGLRDTRDRDGEKPVLMMNTGSWVSGVDMKNDSFVYIDHDGVGLMRWDDGACRIVCTTHFPSSEILAAKNLVRTPRF